MSKRDYYEVLGVEKGADKDSIKKAYRKLAMKYHPDRNPNNAEAEKMFKEASVAAEILLSDEKRGRYDQFGHAGVEGQAGGAGGFSGDFGDLGDIFGDIFGDFLGGSGGRRRRGGTRVQAGDDLQVRLVVSFKEAAFGVKKDLGIFRSIRCSACNGIGGKDGSRPMACGTCHGHGEIRRQQGFFTVASTCHICRGSGQVISNPCNQCSGSGLSKKKVDLEVSVPAGIDSGQRLKLSGEGDVGRNAGPSGDLYVAIEVERHDFFQRDGFDVHCIIPISFSQAALGAELEVPTLAGKVMVNVPTGTQSGKKMRLKAKGIQKLGGYGYGDQILTIHVETPTKLSSEQKKLFEDLAKFDNSRSNPMGKGFFDKVKDLFQ